MVCRGLDVNLSGKVGGTAAAAPPPFRPGNPALCGSYPLVTPYYCRLGDLLCFVFIVSLLYFIFVNCVIYVCLQYFDTVGWVLRPVKTVARITYTQYTVLVETLNPAQSINHGILFQHRYAAAILHPRFKFLPVTVYHVKP